MLDEGYPLGGSGIVWGWFVGNLVVLHLGLVWPILRLHKRGWRIVEYVWLSSAALGLIGLTGQARQMVAGARVGNEALRIEGAMNLVRNTVSRHSLPAVCSPIQPSPLFTEAERAEEQSKLDQMCAWSRAALTLLPQGRLTEPFDVGTLPAMPILKGWEREQAEYARWLDNYRRVVAHVEAMRRAIDRSDGEMMLVFLSPFILAFALALRITKVAGEWRLDAVNESPGPVIGVVSSGD